LRRTIQFIFAIAEAANFHLPALKFSLAQNAKTFVVERHPVSTPIFGAQNQNPMIEIKMGGHVHRAVCSVRRKAQSGRRLIVRSGKFLVANR
jgi:hypothetical protein